MNEGEFVLDAVPRSPRNSRQARHPGRPFAALPCRFAGGRDAMRRPGAASCARGAWLRRLPGVPL